MNCCAKCGKEVMPGVIICNSCILSMCGVHESWELDQSPDEPNALWPKTNNQLRQITERKNND